MTPEQLKAKELVEKFQFSYFELEECKECALICVSEIKEAIDWHDYEFPNSEFERWTKVEEEIKKL